MNEMGLFDFIHDKVLDEIDRHKERKENEKTRIDERKKVFQEMQDLRQNFIDGIYELGSKWQAEKILSFLNAICKEFEISIIAGDPRTSDEISDFVERQQGDCRRPIESAIEARWILVDQYNERFEPTLLRTNRRGKRVYLATENLTKNKPMAWIRDEIFAYDYDVRKRNEKLEEESRQAKLQEKKMKEKADAILAEEEKRKKEAAILAERRRLKIYRRKQYQKLVGHIPKEREDDDEWIQSESVKAEKKAKLHSEKISKFFIRAKINDDLQKMVKREWDTPIDDIAYIHARGWISENNMYPVIHSILNKRGKKALNVDDGDYLFRFREHTQLLVALSVGAQSMDWAKQLLESGFADNVTAMEMVLDGMSVKVARKAYGIEPGPDPSPVSLPEINDDTFDSDDEDNELLL